MGHYITGNVPEQILVHLWMNLRFSTFIPNYCTLVTETRTFVSALEWGNGITIKHCVWGVGRNTTRPYESVVQNFPLHFLKCEEILLIIRLAFGTWIHNLTTWPNSELWWGSDQLLSCTGVVTPWSCTWTSACHSLKQLLMAFLLLELPTFTVGMIFRGRSHCTKRFSSK